MSQRTFGVHAILSHPWVYDLLQIMIGGRKSRKAFVDEYIKPDSGYRILDIGCGTAEILRYLPDDIEYYGFDHSPKYIAAAKKRFEGIGHFVCGPIEEISLSALPKFDVVLVLGVLHHLDDCSARQLVKLAKTALIDNGRLVTIDPCLAPEQSFLAKFLIRNDRGQNVRDKGGYLDLTSGFFYEVRGTLRHQKWIPYTHWVMECFQHAK